MTFDIAHIPLLSAASAANRGRKPGPQMILDMAEEHGIRLKDSWMIGDRGTDIQAGQAAGTRTILLPEAPDSPETNVEPDFRASNLVEAAEIILRENSISGKIP